MATGTKFTTKAGDFAVAVSAGSATNLLAVTSTGAMTIGTAAAAITIGVSAALGANATGVPILGTYTSATSVTAGGNNLSIPVVAKDGTTYFLIARSSAM